MHLVIFLLQPKPRFRKKNQSGNPPSENQYFSTFQIPLERGTNGI